MVEEQQTAALLCEIKADFSVRKVDHQLCIKMLILGVCKLVVLRESGNRSGGEKTKVVKGSIFFALIFKKRLPCYRSRSSDFFQSGTMILAMNDRSNGIWFHSR